MDESHIRGRVSNRDTGYNFVLTVIFAGLCLLCSWGWTTEYINNQQCRNDLQRAKTRQLVRQDAGGRHVCIVPVDEQHPVGDGRSQRRRPIVEMAGVEQDQRVFDSDRPLEPDKGQRHQALQRVRKALRGREQGQEEKEPLSLEEI